MLPIFQFGLSTESPWPPLRLFQGQPSIGSHVREGTGARRLVRSLMHQAALQGKVDPDEEAVGLRRFCLERPWRRVRIDMQRRDWLLPFRYCPNSVSPSPRPKNANPAACPSVGTTNARSRYRLNRSHEDSATNKHPWQAAPSRCLSE